MVKRATLDDVRPVLNDLEKVVDVADATIDKVENVIDSGVESVESVIENGVHVAAAGGHKAVHFLRSPKMAALVIFSCGVAGAGFAGWKLAQRRYKKQFEQELEREIESARQFYARMNKAGEFATPEEAASVLIAQTTEEEADILTEKEATEALKTYQGKTDYTRITVPKDRLVEGQDVDPRDTTVEVVTSNVFVGGKPLDPEEFDFDTELAQRTDDAPYVISFDEFAQNESEFPQTTFTYFDGDDILTDERDDIILDVDGTIGSDSLARFGAGSKDPNVVYVRNPKTAIEFEVTRSEGKYAEEVAGFHDIQRNSVRKMRRGDDG